MKLGEFFPYSLEAFFRHPKVRRLLYMYNPPSQGGGGDLSNYVTKTGTETLTGKTISDADNTLVVEQASVTGLVDDLAGKDGVDTHSALAYTATTNIDFNSPNNLRTLTLTGDVTFTASNMVAARSRVIRIVSDGTHSLTFPAGWKWQGTAPTSIGAKVGILSLLSFGTTHADVVAAFSVES